MSFAAHIRNHLTTRALDGGIPEASWLGRPIDVRHFRVPLSTCYAYIEKQQRDGTLDARRIKGVFVGYADDSRSYRVYDAD